jgi:hypothetical protein
MQIVDKMSQLLLIATAQNVSNMAKNRETKSINISLRLLPHYWQLHKYLLYAPMMPK